MSRLRMFLLCRVGLHLALPKWGPVEMGSVNGRHGEIQQRICQDCGANFWRKA